MSDRAIITVQLGHYANHVGAHFWNMQVRSTDSVHLMRQKWFCGLLFRSFCSLKNEI